MDQLKFISISHNFAVINNDKAISNYKFYKIKTN